MGKTTLAANLAVAHARAGQRVLVVRMDPQDGCLSFLLGVNTDRSADDSNDLVRHMIGRPIGEFDALIREVEHGVDVVPSHNMLERLTQLLLKAAELEGDTRPDPAYEYPRHEQLLHALREADVPSRYDMLVIDPPATAGPYLYNALYATRNLVIPLELSGKGNRASRGCRTSYRGWSRNSTSASARSPRCPTR